VGNVLAHQFGTHFTSKVRGFYIYVGWVRAKSFARKTFGAKRVFVAHRFAYGFIKQLNQMDF